MQFWELEVCLTRQSKCTILEITMRTHSLFQSVLMMCCIPVSPFPSFRRLCPCCYRTNIIHLNDVGIIAQDLALSSSVKPKLDLLTSSFDDFISLNVQSPTATQSNESHNQIMSIMKVKSAIRHNRPVLLNDYNHHQKRFNCTAHVHSHSTRRIAARVTMQL